MNNSRRFSVVYDWMGAQMNFALEFMNQFTEA